jgi:selenocysteine lyase/cysteine desulfurase
MFADFGCAPFYVRSEHLEWLRPDRFGHAQVAENLPDHRFRLRDTAEKYEHANVAFGPVTALDAALALLEEVGLARIEEHTVALAAELRTAIWDLGIELFTPPNNASSIVSFYHGLDPDALYEGLAAANCPVTFQEQGRLVRSAVAMFNNKDDVDRLVGVLAALV